MSERAAQMQEMIAGGSTLAQVGEEFGVSRQRVGQIVGPVGQRPRKMDESMVKARMDAYTRVLDGQTTMVEEAEELGISVKTLYEWLYRRGFHVRNSPLHGTYYRYQRGCRCDECKRGRQEYFRLRVERGPKVHGTSSAYKNFGCRCAPCRKAGSVDNRAQRERRNLRIKRERRRIAES